MIDTIKNLLESFYVVLNYINKTVNIFTHKINVSLINILKIRKIYRATPLICKLSILLGTIDLVNYEFFP